MATLNTPENRQLALDYLAAHNAGFQVYTILSGNLLNTGYFEPMQQLYPV